jgi:predicted outer membrane repeat protein
VYGGGWGSHFTITGNHAVYNGGGFWLNANYYNLKDGTISNNSAGHNGGGIYGENHYQFYGFERCLISDNSAGDDGGGIYHREIISPTYSAPFYLSCRITGNRAVHDGGGIAAVQSKFLMVRCTVLRNEALSGGGVHCLESDLIMANSLIVRNAADTGGGMTICGGEPELKNCTFHGNAAESKGGGIYCWAYATAQIKNSILCNDRAPAGREVWIGETGEQAKIVMRFSDLVGGMHVAYIHPMSVLQLGDNVINADPLFSDPVNGDYHLLYPSPCRNAGYNFFIHDLYDFENDARVTDKTVDMGADEFHHHLYCTGETVPGGEIVLNLTAKPLRSATLFIGTEVLADPVTTPFGMFYLTLPVTPLDMGTVPWCGLASLRERIPPSCPTPLTIPVQAFVQDKLTNLCTITVEGP